MDKLTAIKGALCIIAAFVSTSVFGDQLPPKANDERAAGIHLSRGEPSDVPRHTTAPETSDDFASPPESTSPSDKLGSEGKALPPKFELEISLTMRRVRIARGRHRAPRSSR
jgi:hypothetical protein